MKVKTFRGGVHPPGRKNSTKDSPIERIPRPKTVVIPVNQHFGAPNQPLVAAGDRVLKGQRIADAESGLTVPLHASVTGYVKKIEVRHLATNLDGPCIVIESDGTDEYSFMAPLDPFLCTKEEALKRVKDAGVVGMGGAGFPAYVKLSPPPGKPISCLIANGAECESYLTIDERTMLEAPGEVVYGVLASMKILGVEEGIIAIEDNKARLVPVLEGAIAKVLADEAAAKRLSHVEVPFLARAKVTVQLLRTKYPQGGEKTLIQTVIGREVPSGGLPMDVGVVVLNVGSLKSISDAFRKGQPLVERGLTLSGGACRKPRNLLVPVGTLASDLVDPAADIDPGYAKLVFGGPMMGTAQARLDVPVQKNTSGVLFLERGETVVEPESQCIRCGNCMRVCTCRLSPMLMNSALMAGDLDEAGEIGVMDCVECGTCSYACPARIQLVQRFRVGKQLIRAKKQKEAANAPK